MRGIKQEYSGKRFSLFILLRELHLTKGPDTDAIVCSNDMLELHNIINNCIT